MSRSDTEDEGPLPPAALRLTFSYRDGEIELIDRQRIRKRTVPGASFGDLLPEGGLLLELRAESGSPLFEGVLPRAIPKDVEVFAPVDERSVARAAIDNPDAIFSVVVPDIEDAVQVVILAEPHQESTGPATRSVIGRFDLYERPSP